MKTRKIILYAADIFILAMVFAVTVLFFGASNTIEIAGRGDYVRLLVMFLFFAVLIFGMRTLFQVYGDIWRYARGMVYFKVVLADFLAGLIALIVGRLYKPLELGFGGTLCIVALNCLAVLTSRFLYQIWYGWYNGREERTAAIKLILPLSEPAMSARFWPRS